MKKKKKTREQSGMGSKGNTAPQDYYLRTAASNGDKINQLHRIKMKMQLS